MTNAIDQINAQLPTGSLKGYFNSALNNIESTLSSNAYNIYIVVLVSIILMMFLLYAMLCIVLMATGTIGVAMGIALIFIGLIISLITFLLASTEGKSFGSNIEESISAELNPLIDNLYCAVLSGVCCYSGASCCCPNGTGAVCKNPPFPP
jgi:ABC-type multidrug transport system fused ATPase/permease subunit